MGNDGGSIPTRRELVKNAARALNTSELKATQLESSTHAWTYCPLSNRALAPPIVSDSNGILYNKDAILESLLPSAASSTPEALPKSIKGLRDIVEVKFQIVKEGKEEKKICPITSKELGPATRAVYLVPCGHVFSEAAIREVRGETCVECNEGFKEEDVIPILPVAEEEKERLRSRMEKLRERGLTHSLKKAPGSKKRKKGAVDTEVEAGPEKTGSTEAISEKTKPREGQTGNSTPQNQDKSSSSTPVPASSSGIKNAATASLTAKVLDEQEERNKRRKMGLNNNLKSLFSNKGYDAQTHKSGDFMTRGFSLPKKT